jgi:chromosome segregation ATPase
MLLDMNKKITTIDELAVMTNKSFEAVEAQIAKGQEQITAHTARLETRMDKFEKYVEGRFDGMENRFDDISRELKEGKNRIKEVDTREAVVNLEVRVDKIERELKMGV